MRPSHAAAAALLAVAAVSPGARAEPQGTLVEFGPVVGLVKRATETSNTSYDVGVAKGASLRGRWSSWLWFSTRYLRAYHAVSLGSDALGVQGDSYSTEPMRVETLQAAAHPTWRLHPRLAVLATVGIGWSGMRMAAVAVDGQRAHLPPRRGVFQEVPLGLGVVGEVVPQWLTLSLDVMLALPYSRSGDAFAKETAYRDGQPLPVGPFPRPTMSTYALLTAAVAL
ncbi:MAG: hypothetical protein IT374_22045 [Polyangiaceae bacterium]|nr:hypothetical protein [Polyangiaceae bacterium]